MNFTCISDHAIFRCVIVYYNFIFRLTSTMYKMCSNNFAMLQLCIAPFSYSKRCIITRLTQFLLPFALLLFVFFLYVLFFSVSSLSFPPLFFSISLFLSCYMMQQCITIKGAQTFVKPRIAGFLSAPWHLYEFAVVK